ncbi:MAG: autotransporter-associated beta strand repeat-containing protein, partial [Verrucomicrobiaceae bacterium]|nr:autotransporter-associated beta strand repeat-containing protein [Verrucomicrobiaceae bacterium]
MNSNTTPNASRTGYRNSPTLKWMRNHLRLPVTGLMIAALAAWTAQSNAANGSWISDAAANWTDTVRWQGSIVPNGVGDVATIRNDISAARTITLNTAVTLGGLKLGDLLGGSVFTLGGANALTMSASSGNAFINKYGSATDVISAPLVLTSNTDFNLFTGTMDVTGALTGAGNLIKNQAGALRLSSSTGYAGNYVVNFGTLNIGGANGATPGGLGTGTGGIQLVGHGRQDLAILVLNNNGAASDGTSTYSGNNDVILSGGAQLTVDRNFSSGANDRVNHVLDNLTVNGGILRVTSGNSHRLTFAGTTLLNGQTNVIEPLANLTATLANLTLAGVIDDGAGTNHLTKEGAGRLAITNTANTYGGVTAIKDGVVHLAAGATLGGGLTYVNGGVLSVADSATLSGVAAAGGIALVGQLGITRYALPAIGYSGSANIDGANPFGSSLSVPVSGMVLAIDGVTGTSSTNSANIDMAQVAGGSSNVWLGNVVGFDRTYTGTLTNGVSGDLRLISAANTLILSAANQLGGAAASNNLVFGLGHSNAILTVGAHIGQATALLTGTTAGSGVVSVRANNANTLGTVTVNRGQIVEVNGTGVTTGLGTGAVTVIGGTVRSDATTDAKFGNTDFKLYSGGTLQLDNSAVAANNTDRRLLNTSNIDLSTSTLRLIGDGGVAGNTSSQTVASVDYRGGSTISVDRDGATGSTTVLTAGTLNRVDRGTLNIRSLSAQTTTFGTAAGTQKLIITAAPTPTNGMIGANLVLWGGTTSNDGTQPLFVNYDATHGVQAAAFTHTNTLTGVGAGSIVTFDATAYSGAGASIQALRIRTTANTSTFFNASSPMTIGSTAAVGQGAGLFLIHTADNAIAHSAGFNFGTQEAMIYTSTTGGSSVVNLTGVLTGSNGLTKFGDGALQLSGTNTYTGVTTLNAGELRLNNIAATGGSASSPSQIDLNGGALYLAGSQRYYASATLYDNARFGNVNIGSAGMDSLTIAARPGTSAPLVLDVRNQAGGNITTLYGNLNMSANGLLAISHPLQVNAGITGSGNIEKYQNERLIVAGDSSGYSGNITAYAGVLQSYTASSTAKPFGSANTITINPGAHLILAAPSNVNNGQVTINSDHGGISTIGQLYVADPATTLPTMSINSSAPWKVAFAIGAVGFSQDINQSTLFGGNTYLGAALGYTGIYTGNL